MFCFWCETGKVPKRLREKDYVWIHLDCMQILMNFKDDFESVREILKENKNESVESFLKRMTQFDKRIKIITKRIKDTY